MIAAVAICAVAVIVLLAGEYRKHKLMRVIAKTIASLAFVVGAWSSSAFQDPSCDPVGWDDYSRIMLIGLVLRLAGDIALLGKSSRAFLVGLVAFLLGHIAYVVAFAQLAPPSTWLHPFALAPVIVGGIALYLLWPRLGEMRLPVIIYVLAIVAMMAAAIAVARIPALPDHVRALIVIGAALFFVSDLAVARDKFVGASFTNRAWGLPTYYAGQLLIAWSIWPLFDGRCDIPWSP